MAAEKQEIEPQNEETNFKTKRLFCIEVGDSLLASYAIHVRTTDKKLHIKIPQSIFGSM
jgi:hypothetical protein